MFAGITKFNANFNSKDELLAWHFIGAINTHINLAWNRAFENKLDINTAKEIARQFMHGVCS